MTSTTRILVVEDDTGIRMSLAEVLADEGYEVATAENGAEALAFLRNGGSPAVILLDLTMPVMDGWAFRAVQCRDPALAAIPTVIFSAGFANDVRELAALHPAAFLSKPFDLERLLDTIDRLATAPAPSAALVTAAG